MFTCSKTYRDVPFAHRQWTHKGHCRNIHGHNWSITFTFEAHHRDANGFVVDFGDLDWLKITMGVFDHALVLNANDPHLNDIAQTAQLIGEDNIITVPDASCEGLARYFADYAHKMLQEYTKGRAGVVSVRVEEDSKNSATYERFPRLEFDAESETYPRRP